MARIAKFLFAGSVAMVLAFLVIGAGMLLFILVAGPGGRDNGLPKETSEPPLAQQIPTGPFRPRPPKPLPPLPPSPTPENDVERRLFPRIEALIDSRTSRVEARAEAKVEEALNDVADKMNAVVEGAEPELMQGFFGGAFVTAMVKFIAKAVYNAVKLIILGVLWGMIVQYWFIVAPVAVFLFIALPAWSARTFVKQSPPPAVIPAPEKPKAP